jgi:hypothetical protein
MCQDGGRIWECDTPGCERGVCSNCIDIPPSELSQLDRPDVHFTCVSCEWIAKGNRKEDQIEEPYFVGPFFFLVKLYMIYLFIYLLLLLFFQGFTIGGQPVFDHFLKVKGTFELATNASVQSPPTLMIHLRLKNLPHLAHFTIVHELLAEYYHESEGQLQVLDMPFAIENDEEAAEWTVMVTNQLRMLRPHEHAVVFITTHSDPDRGDLWTKKSESPHEEPCAVTVSDVSSGVFYQIILILIINSTVALYNPWPFFCQA